MAAKELEFAQADARLNQHINAARTFNRRNFMAGLGVAGAAVAGAGLLSGCGNNGTVVSAATSEADVLNFALNLEYFEATFYSYLVTGADIPAASTGNSGTVTGAPAKLTGLPSYLADMFAEIYYDELSHVNDLRTALGPAAVARPNLALAAITTGNYISAARLAEDIGVTAYSGAATLLTASNLQAAAQILSVEGFHAGALRYVAIREFNSTGVAAYPTGLKPADNYDIPPIDAGATLQTAGPTLAGGGFFATTGNAGTTAQTNTFPGFAYRRTTSQVLAAVYANSTAGTASGGFFPNGLNGNIKTV